MSTETIKIPRPTRIELLRLRRRLALARRFHSLLRDREIYLLEVFRETLKSVVEARRRLNELLIKAYSSYYTALYLHGLEALEVYSSTVPAIAKLQVSYKNIMGVWSYSYNITDIPTPQPYLPLELSELQLTRKEILELLTKIAEYEKALVNLGAEIRRLRRIVNMLEKVYIPRLERTIRYLTMKFDEMRREETIRAIKIKRRITRE
ncbi:MAG: V-type ATP synthase subunit D [Desulfurococcaceae archaeon]|jgi:V/A-type H+-transporting ATPase subunit D|nr:V-type ATP synthase subunit D [Desulfurococcaceae archaeon]